MAVRLSTNAKLVIASTFATLLLLVIGLEVYEGSRYAAWRAEYEGKVESGETLAVASANDRLIWEYRPNAVHEPLAIRTNAHGFRGSDDVTVEKPDDVYRIAFIGDSATLGMFVAERETFVRRFEVLANALGAGIKFETLNFGIDGYNTRQIAELLRSRTVAYQPDKVLYMMHLNDFDFEDSSGQKIRYFRRPVSFVLELVRRLYDEAVLGKSGREYHLFHFAKRKADVLREIDAMQALAADRGFDFQIIVLPLLGRSFRDYDYRVIHDELAGAFSKRGIAYVDLLSAFGNQNTAPLFFAHDMWHPNARGHAFIASRLVEPVLGAKFEAARRAAPSRRWMRVAPDLLSLDFSALDGITVTEARRRTRSGGAVEERVTLDGGKGMVAVEHLPDALIDPALARSLGRKETLMAKFRETGARLRFPAMIERLVNLSGARSVGGYARYAIPRAGLSCVFAYAGYGLGDPGRFTVRGYDTLVSLNYCGRTSREDVIARFLRGLSARPAEGPA